ncbi:hypothetical protein RTP6_006592 [Batrachochytrium dendrobatidis]
MFMTNDMTTNAKTPSTAKTLIKPAGFSFTAKLPLYNGPFNVGMMDIETKPLAQSDSSEIKGMPYKRGLLVRIYYPTTVTSNSCKKPHWLPISPLYALGYSSFLNLPWIIGRMLVSPLTSKVTIPSYWQTPLAHPSDTQTTIPSIPHRLPVVVFSHGLAGMRTTYSTLCGSLAAKGFIVLVPEHSDGSACATIRQSNSSTSTQHEHIAYLRPDKTSVLPGETTDDYLLRLRRAQVEIRADEVDACIEILKKLDMGSFDPKDNLIGNHAESGPCIDSFKSRVDFQHMVMAGHSFGGATTITVLSRPNMPFRCGIILDPWMFPVHNPNVTVPYLSIQSETFHWKTNLDQMRSMMGLVPYSNTTDSTAASTVLTTSTLQHPHTRFGYIRHTAHNNPSDFSGLFPTVIQWAGQAGSADALRVYRINDDWMCEFIATIYEQMELKLPRSAEYKIGQEQDEMIAVGDQAWNDLYSRLKK